MSINSGNNFGGSGFPPPGGSVPGGGGPGGPPEPKREGGTYSQEYKHTPVSARVPEKVARGVLSTGVLVLDGPNEFVIDFMQALTRPFNVATRVVLPPPVMEQFIAALRDNVQKFEQRFGAPAPLPKPPADRRPTIQEIYDEFKLADEQMSGTYANAVMVGHSASEFFFDFITNFFPTSAVSARVFLSAQQVPRMLEAVTMAHQRWAQRMQQQRQLPAPPPQPPPEPPKANE